MGKSKNQAVLQFSKEEDLEKLPTITEEMEKHLCSNISAVSNHNASTQEWAPRRAKTRDPIPAAILAIFIQLAAVDGKLVPCQVDVNGKRFIECGENPRQDDLQLFNTTAISYKVVAADHNGHNLAKVLAMTYEHSAECASLQTGVNHATADVTKDDALELFEIFFGCKPHPKLWENRIEDEGPCVLLLMLLSYIDCAYDLRKDSPVAWRQLLTTIARHAFGNETCIQRLNALGLHSEKLKPITLCILSCIIKVKFAFLVGEAHVLGALQSLLLGRRFAGYKMNAATNLLQPNPRLSHTLPCNDLKCMSNELTKNSRAACISGSFKDFSLDMLSRYMTQRKQLEENNKAYLEDLEASSAKALDEIVAAATHNPHLNKVIDSYKRLLMGQGGEIRQGDIQQRELDAFTLDTGHILEQFESIRGNPNAFAPHSNAKGPKVIFILLIIMTDFCDEDNAKELSSFAQTDTAVSLPSTNVVLFKDSMVP